jgi:5-methylcytosine-specific restriction endonuclease McrA
MSPYVRPCAACGARTVPGEPCPVCSSRSQRTSCAECGVLTAGSTYCPEHAYLEGEAGRTLRLPYRQHYRTPEFRRNRALAIARARGRCERCGHPHGPGKQVDHVKAIRDGGGDGLENLMVLCPNCTRLKNRLDKARRRT